jgi:hypothetical protein
MMMDVASTSETFVNFYQTAWCYSPEDSHFYIPPIGIACLQSSSRVRVEASNQKYLIVCYLKTSHVDMKFSLQ